jgi:class 3 adenylate cyclase
LGRGTAGEVYLAYAGERYFGLAVHRAARICAVGRSGQTVVSETTRALLEDE